MQSYGFETLEFIEKDGLEGSSDHLVQNCHISVFEMGVGGFLRIKIILDAAFSMAYALFMSLYPCRKAELVFTGVLSA